MRRNGKVSFWTYFLFSVCYAHLVCINFIRIGTFTLREITGCVTNDQTNQPTNLLTWSQYIPTDVTKTLQMLTRLHSANDRLTPLAYFCVGNCVECHLIHRNLYRRFLRAHFREFLTGQSWKSIWRLPRCWFGTASWKEYVYRLRDDGICWLCYCGETKLWYTGAQEGWGWTPYNLELRSEIACRLYLTGVNDHLSNVNTSETTCLHSPTVTCATLTAKFKVCFSLF